MSAEMAIGMVSGTLVGAGLLIAALYQRSKLRASQGWPRVIGTISKAAIARDEGPDSSGYSVNLAYDYEVNGVRYTGNRIGLSRRCYVRKKRAQAELDRYPVNSNGTVYFDPRKPADAVLSREYPDNIALMVYGAALLAIVAAGLLWGRG